MTSAVRRLLRSIRPRQSLIPQTLACKTEFHLRIDSVLKNQTPRSFNYRPVALNHVGDHFEKRSHPAHAPQVLVRDDL